MSETFITEIDNPSGFSFAPHFKPGTFPLAQRRRAGLKDTDGVGRSDILIRGHGQDVMGDHSG